jgi:hypothetical protein
MTAYNDGVTPGNPQGSSGVWYIDPVLLLELDNTAASPAYSGALDDATCLGVEAAAAARKIVVDKEAGHTSHGWRCHSTLSLAGIKLSFIRGAHSDLAAIAAVFCRNNGAALGPQAARRARSTSPSAEQTRPMGSAAWLTRTSTISHPCGP